MTEPRASVTTLVHDTFAKVVHTPRPFQPRALLAVQRVRGRCRERQHAAPPVPGSTVCIAPNHCFWGCCAVGGRLGGGGGVDTQ